MDIDALGWFQAVMAAFQGNAGGVALLLLVQALTLYGLWQCKRDHRISRANEAKLSAVVVELHGAVAAFTGRRVVELEDLSSLLDGSKPLVSALKYGRPAK